MSFNLGYSVRTNDNDDDGEGGWDLPIDDAGYGWASTLEERVDGLSAKKKPKLATESREPAIHGQVFYQKEKTKHLFYLFNKENYHYQLFAFRVEGKDGKFEYLFHTPPTSIPEPLQPFLTGENEAAPAAEPKKEAVDTKKEAAAAPKKAEKEEFGGYDFDMSGLKFSSGAGGRVLPSLPATVQSKLQSEHKSSWRSLVETSLPWRAMHEKYPTKGLNKFYVMDIEGGGDCGPATLAAAYNGFHGKGLLNTALARQLATEALTVENIDAFLLGSTSTLEFPAAALRHVVSPARKLTTTKNLMKVLGNTYWWENLTFSHPILNHPTFVSEHIGFVIISADWKKFRTAPAAKK